MRALLGTLFALSIAKAAISLWEFRGQSGTFLFAHLRGHGNEASVYSPHSKPAPAATDSTPSEENPSKERSLRGIKAVGDPSGWCHGGLIGGYTCCPASCGACGGDDCANRPGGKACCTDVVLKLCQTPNDTSGCAVAHLAYAHYEAAGILWRQEAMIHAASADAGAATARNRINLTHEVLELDHDSANFAPHRSLLSDESFGRSNIYSSSTGTINRATSSSSMRSSTSSSKSAESSQDGHDDGCGALPNAGEALAARVQAASKGCGIVVFSTVNYPLGTRLPDPREMLDFGKESFLVGLNNGTFLEDWRTCFVLVVGAASAVDLKQRHGSDMSPWILVLDHIDEDDEKGHFIKRDKPLSETLESARRRRRRRLHEVDSLVHSGNSNDSLLNVDISATINNSSTSARNDDTRSNSSSKKGDKEENLDENSGRRASRLLKIMPHRFFPHAKATVFVDWKLKIMQHPALLVWRTLTAHGGEVGFATFRHPCTTAYTTNPLCSPQWATPAKLKVNITAARLALLKANFSDQEQSKIEEGIGSGGDRRGRGVEDRSHGDMHHQHRQHRRQHRPHRRYQHRVQRYWDQEHQEQQQQSRRQLQSRFFGTKDAARGISNDPWFNAWGNEEDFTYEDDLVDLPDLSRQDEVKAEHLDARRWWRRELRLVLDSNKTSNVEAVRAQQARYRQEGLDLRHYAEGGLVITAPQAKHAQALACRWWKEYSRRDSCDRDQPALAAALAYTLNPRGSKHHGLKNHGHARAHSMESKHKIKDHSRSRNEDALLDNPSRDTTRRAANHSKTSSDGSHSALLSYHTSISGSPLVSFGPPSAVLFPHNHQLSLTNEINGSSNDGSNNNSNGDDDDNDSDENDDDGVDGGTAGEGLGDGTGILLLNEGPRGECGALCHWYEGETVSMKRPKVALSRAQLLRQKEVKTALLAKKAAKKAASEAARRVHYKEAELTAAKSDAQTAGAAGNLAKATEARKAAARHTVALEKLIRELNKLEAEVSASSTNSVAVPA